MQKDHEPKDGDPGDQRPEGDTPAARWGRRQFMFGSTAVGVGLAAGMIANAEPADAANGASVLLGKANTASATTSVATTTGNGLQGQTSQAGQNGVYGVDTSPSAGHGVYGTSTNNIGVKGSSTKGVGVYGSTAANNRYGVQGVDTSPAGGFGVSGTSTHGTGVVGTTSADLSNGVEGIDNSTGGGFGVAGSSSNGGDGVYGLSSTGRGVYGDTDSGYGVYGETNSGYGVYGAADTDGTGVYGTSIKGVGVIGSSPNSGVLGSSSGTGTGVTGLSSDGTGVYGGGDGNNPGVYGVSSNGAGVYGSSTSGEGVQGQGAIGVFGGSSSNEGIGIKGYAYGSSGGCAGVSGASASDPDGYGVYASAGAGTAIYANGNAEVTGTLSKGGGSFKIDHPLDPAHKYLYHSFVESPDMMNVYNGLVLLDETGRATVDLPEWFETLNRDFRYQLTAIGAPAPDLHIATEVADGSFGIAGGSPGLNVSWQVTGIRQDAWANANRIPVDADKPAADQGRYLHPELYEDGQGQPVRAIMVGRRHTERTPPALRSPLVR